jgi:hypothetical protein
MSPAVREERIRRGKNAKKIISGTSCGVNGRKVDNVYERSWKGIPTISPNQEDEEPDLAVRCQLSLSRAADIEVE